MPMYTPNAGPILPEEVSALVVQPVTRESVAMQTATVVTTGSHTFRIPRVTEDPTAAWVAEGAEITPDDMTLDEIDVTPSKVAGLTIISRELADDSDPAANNVVGDGLARDIARKVDAAFFGALASPAPSGLGALAGTTPVAAGVAFANLDPFAEAMSEAEQLGATLTAFVANPADALALAQLKDATGSNRPLLGVDPTQPTRRTIFGVPLYVSADVTAGTVWGYDRDKVWIVLRDDAKIEVDRSVFFTSDRVAIKATMRVGFAFTQPATVVEITTGA